MFAQVLIIQFLDKGHISSLRNDALLIKHRDDTERLLDEFNTGLQIQTEINEGPGNAFTFVLFLFENEHVMVEELLETFIDEVDPQLLETVQVEDLETGDIEHTNEVFAFDRFSIESLVATTNQPTELTGINGLAETW